MAGPIFEELGYRAGLDEINAFFGPSPSPPPRSKVPPTRCRTDKPQDLALPELHLEQDDVVAADFAELQEPMAKVPPQEQHEVKLDAAALVFAKPLEVVRLPPSEPTQTKDEVDRIQRAGIHGIDAQQNHGDEFGGLSGAPRQKGRAKTEDVSGEAQLVVEAGASDESTKLTEDVDKPTLSEPLREDVVATTNESSAQEEKEHELEIASAVRLRDNEENVGAEGDDTWAADEFAGLMEDIESYSHSVRYESSSLEQSLELSLPSHAPETAAAQLRFQQPQRKDTPVASNGSDGDNDKPLQHVQDDPIRPSSIAKSQPDVEMRADEETQNNLLPMSQHSRSVHQPTPPPIHQLSHQHIGLPPQPNRPLFRRTTIEVRDGHAFVQKMLTPARMDRVFQPHSMINGFQYIVGGSKFTPNGSPDAHERTVDISDAPHYPKDQPSAPPSSLLTPADDKTTESTAQGRHEKRRRDSSLSQQTSPQAKRPSKQQKLTRSLSITGDEDAQPSPEKQSSPWSRGTPKKDKIRLSNFPPEMDNVVGTLPPSKPDFGAEANPNPKQAPMYRRQTINNADIPPAASNTGESADPEGEIPLIPTKQKKALQRRPPQSTSPVDTEAEPPPSPTIITTSTTKKPKRTKRTRPSTPDPAIPAPKKPVGGHLLGKNELGRLLQDTVLSGVSRQDSSNKKVKKPSPRKTRAQREEEARAAPNASEAVKKRRRRTTAGEGK